MEVAGSQQASRSATGSQDCRSMQKLQQTQLTPFTDAHVAANAMPAASQAATTAALTPQPALGAAAAASAEASVASQAEPESAFADVDSNAAKANETAHNLKQFSDMPVVKALVQCSGTGCEDVLVMCERAKPACRVKQRDSWVSRSFRGEAHSSCTLQLLHKNQRGICIKVCICQIACLDTLYNFLPTLCSPFCPVPDPSLPPFPLLLCWPCWSHPCTSLVTGSRHPSFTPRVVAWRVGNPILHGLMSHLYIPTPDSQDRL